jgi:hypothetical protein
VSEDDVGKTRDERPSRRETPRLDHATTEPAVIEDASPLDAGRRYTLGAEIARGGMGRVVEATDTLLGRKVALKAALAAEPDAVRRFARETAITARLEHPSIVPVYDAGKTPDGLPYYVMRKIAGRPLDTLINQRRTIDDRLGLLPNVLSAVEAVAHAHGRNVLHRDLKPANILVGELGETIVIDWGLAKVIGDADDQPGDEDPAAGLAADLQTRAGQVVGTPGFMAPEQLQGKPATRACDVYALGATLYHVLAGEPPHAARSSDEMIALALRGPPLPIEEVTSGVPAELAAIVDRAMAYDLGERYADANALAADLRRFLTGQLVAAHEYSSLERALRFVKRHRAAVAVALIAVTVVALIAYLSVTRIVRERNAADDARELALVEKRAAEDARTSEARRADDLLVSQASALVATNPTTAVALLHTLPATSTNWKKARAVLADARARGVPWVLPASGFTSSLVVTRDGTTAFSGGNDGIVRRHDLAKRTTVELHRGSGNTLLALAGDDKLLAIADGSGLVWSYGGATDRVTLDRPIEHLAAAGTAAVFHDGKALWMLRHGDSSPSKIDIAATKVFGLSASPDGARVVVNAQPETLVVELAPVPRVIVRRPSRSMEPAWAASGKHLAIASLQGLDEIDFTGATPATRTIATLPNVQAAAYVGLDLYFTTGAQTSYRHHAGDGVVQIDLPAATYSSATSTRDGAVFVSMSGTVAITGRGGTLVLRGPVPRMFRATANPNATRFLVAVHDRLLLYDASALLPRTLDTPFANTTFHGFAGEHHYLMAYMQDDWRLFDLATGTSRSLGRLEFGAVLDSAADGSYVIARPNRGAEPVVLRAGQPVMGLPDARHAASMSPTKIVVATIELGANQRTKLWSTPETIRGLATTGPFVVAAAQTKLWRLDTRTNQETSTAWTALPSALDVTADGEVWFAVDHAIWKWSRDGTLARIHSLPRPIKRLTFVAGVGCIVLDDRRTASLIVDAQTPPRAALPATFDAASIAETAPLIAGLVDRKLVVYDLEGNLAWSLGSGDNTAELSESGTRAATHANGHVAIYTLDVPADRAAYQRLLDTTTNLRVAPGAANELVWP